MTATAAAATRVQTAVIGAGVVGLACARALARSGREVVILERAAGIGTGTSSRNSEVIHAGIYYTPPTSHKAVMCVKGKQMLYEYCAQRGVPHLNCGKLVVATTAEEMANDLPRIVASAARNGVGDLRIIQPDEVAAMEPEVACHGAIFSPSTGIVDSHTLMVTLLGDAEEAGASLVLDCPLEGIAKTAPADSSGRAGGLVIAAGGMHLHCDEVVNCAGLHAGVVAQMVYNAVHGADTPPAAGAEARSAPSRQYFAKGNYYKLEGQPSPFKHLVYPVPQPGGLGVHATIDLAGATKFGPDVEWVDVACADPDRIDLTPSPSRADGFYAEVRKYWPALCNGNIVPDYAGVRPKLSHPDAPVPGVGADFSIAGPRAHGVPGYVSLLGIESPGLTSSMAIGEHVVGLLAGA